ATLLADLGYRVAIDPSLVDGHVGETIESEVRRQAAALQVSPIAAKASAQTSTPSLAAPPPAAARPATHQR
ncbi:hypothetical protein ACFXPJ_39460, partial [Streptomyces goshikiensis]